MLFCKQMIAGSITSKYSAKIQKSPSQHPMPTYCQVSRKTYRHNGGAITE